MSHLPRNISTWLSEKKIVIEIILVALMLVACIFKFLNLAVGDDALTISMTALAGFYFLQAFIYSTDSQYIQIPNKIFSIGSAVCVIGLLFTFLHLPGAKEQVMIGLISFAVSGLTIIFLAVTGRAQKFIPVLIRLVVLGGLSLNAFLGLSDTVTQ